jgi:RND family efflux transporter MFP subunit
VALHWLPVARADEAASPLTEAAVTPVPVKVLTLKSYTAAEAPRFSGRIEAGDSADLAFRVAGQIEALNVVMGDSVSNGDVLATLDPTDYRLALQAREAEYELARLGAERARTLFKRQLISEDQFDTARTRLATGRARLEQARQQLSYTQLVAPFEGSIAFTYAMPSEVVAAQQPILTLQDITRLDVRFNLPQHYQTLLESPTPATFELEFDLLPGEWVQASVKEVQLQPDPETNSYRVTLMAGEPGNFSPRPGMSVTVRMSHPSLMEGRWLLPREALFDRAADLAHVWRIDDTTGTLVRTAVRLDGAGMLLEGLEPGDRIVAAGVADLREGQKVRAWVREGGL